jgi:hypothetical protein
MVASEEDIDGDEKQLDGLSRIDNGSHQSRKLSSLDADLALVTQVAVVSQLLSSNRKGGTGVP